MKNPTITIERHIGLLIEDEQSAKKLYRRVCNDSYGKQALFHGANIFLNDRWNDLHLDYDEMIVTHPKFAFIFEFSKRRLQLVGCGDVLAFDAWIADATQSDEPIEMFEISDIIAEQLPEMHSLIIDLA